MNTATFAPSGFFVPFQVAIGRWATKLATPRRSAPPMAPNDALIAPNLVATPAVLTGMASQKSIQTKPLRVVRLVEAGDFQGSVGYMVISGRIADVCAELDRLAARENSQVSGERR